MIHSLTLLLFGCGAPDAPTPRLTMFVEPDCPTVPLADGFDLPVGPPDASGYYDAQPFGQNGHLGADWNGNGGGNTDLGAPVHAVGAGRVLVARDEGGGWGNVVRVVHRVDAGCVESLYAHLDEIRVAPGALVGRGDVIGTIGDARGQYRAHLHFEVRDAVLAPLGGGYGRTAWHVDPTAWIQARRPKR